MLERNVDWPPACHTKDSNAAPEHFGTDLTQIHGSYQTKGNCRGSGKSGHYKCECPDRKGSGGGGGGRGNHHGGRGNSGGRGRDHNHTKNSEKITPPPTTETPLRHVNGEPEFEKTIQGRKMFWCQKFNRWSTTHSTGSHTGKKSGSIAQTNFSFVSDPF